MKNLATWLLAAAFTTAALPAFAVEPSVQVGYSPEGSGTAENIDVPDQQPAPSFGDNSLAGGPADADPESEVAAFANREQGRDGTTA